MSRLKFNQKRDFLELCPEVRQKGMCSHLSRLWILWHDLKLSTSKEDLPDYKKFVLAYAEKNKGKYKDVKEYTGKLFPPLDSSGKELDFSAPKNRWIRDHVTINHWPDNYKSVLFEYTDRLKNADTVQAKDILELQEVFKPDCQYYLLIGFIERNHAVAIRIKGKNNYITFDPNHGEHHVGDRKSLLKIFGIHASQKVLLSLYQSKISRAMKYSKWVPDRHSACCQCCDNPISPGLLSTGKHHCRLCGHVICSDCTNQVDAMYRPLYKNEIIIGGERIIPINSPKRKIGYHKEKVCFKCKALLNPVLADDRWW
ncbi:FYVE zinc finger domain-containing protein [Piscirickettsia litoralis]|uniref:FYVE-type domain-containing protein n=1 Tax=Piscirickettsia litoralis TaxID=1891921 RepID=A0ABX3A702_9GAMM|nr:FYVE zinc finger domain-containing protein [Piscirickettsia litoralis]ODN43418.1 hypothetical protein BGC07_11405 [Piscirickettsia litoralis]